MKSQYSSLTDHKTADWSNWAEISVECWNFQIFSSPTNCCTLPIIWILFAILAKIPWIVQENIRNLGNYQFISKLMIFLRTKLNSGANLFRIKVLVDQKFNDVISILNNPSITFSQCGGIICKEQWTNLPLINKDFWPIVIKKCSSRDSFYWLMLILLKITPDLINLTK